MLEALLRTLTSLSSTVYGGTVISFALLFALYRRGTGRSGVALVRVWRATGPILGLCMGLWVLGMLGARYLEHGHIGWGWETPERILDLATWLVFLVLWASSFVLEIWTTDPLRTELPGASDQVRDEAAFWRGYGRVTVHVALNALLVGTWVVLRSLA